MKLAAATREEKNRRNKRIRVGIGCIPSGGGNGGRGGNADIETSSPPGIYLDLNRGKKAGIRILLSIGILRP